MLLTNREQVAHLDSRGEKIYTASFPLPQHNQFRINSHLPVPFNLTVFKAQWANTGGQRVFTHFKI